MLCSFLLDNRFRNALLFLLLVLNNARGQSVVQTAKSYQHILRS